MVRSLCGLAVLLGASHGLEDGLSLLQASKTEDVTVDTEAQKTYQEVEFVDQDQDPNHKKFMIKLRDQTFNCTAFPDYCRGPFNCHLPPAPTTDKGRGVATADGHVNYNHWCKKFPRYSKPMTACVSRDYTKYGKLMYAEQQEMTKNPFRPNQLHLQSQLCFLSGYCNNTKVNEATTVADMEKMCDDRWGHKSWTEFRRLAGPLAAHADSISRGTEGLGKIQRNSGNPLNDLRDVSTDDGFARAYAQLSCGVGNFHCDVMYCRQYFCEDPEWKAKHAQLAWAVKPVEEVKVPRKYAGGGRSTRSKAEWNVILDKVASKLVTA